MLYVARHRFEHIVRTHCNRDTRVINDLEIMDAVSHSGRIFFIGHSVDGRDKVSSRFLPQLDDRVVGLDISVKNTVLYTVNTRFQKLPNIVVIENVRGGFQPVFLTLADDLLHQFFINFLNRDLLIKIPIIPALICKFQKIDSCLLQLFDTGRNLFGSSDGDRHFISCPLAVCTERVGRMTLGCGKVRTDDQKLGTGDLARSQLVAELTDKMLRRIKVFDGRDTVGEYVFGKNTRHFFVEENVAFLLAMTFEAALDMNVAVDKTGHQCFVLAVDDLHILLFNRLIKKLHDLAAFDIDVLMLFLGTVADDDMDIIDEILALFVLFRTGEKFDQQKNNNYGSENHLNESYQRDSKHVRHINHSLLFAENSAEK